MTALRGLALAEATLAHIEAHPEEWDQGVWRCATSACFAGHAALLGGGRWESAEDSWDSWMAAEDDLPDESAAARARRLLDIADDDDRRLFHARNTLADLRRIVAEIWPTDGAQ